MLILPLIPIENRALALAVKTKNKFYWKSLREKSGIMATDELNLPASAELVQLVPHSIVHYSIICTSRLSENLSA